jgi:outer membrane biosynthesis protein TonB
LALETATFMRGSLIVSIVLHILIVVALTVGMPFLSPEKTDPIESAIVVDLVQIAETSTATAATKKADKPTVEPPKPEVKAPTPPKIEPPAPEPQKPTPPRDDPKPEAPKPTPPKEPPPPPKAEAPKPEPAKPAAAKPEPPKPVEKTPDPEKTPDAPKAAPEPPKPAAKPEPPKPAETKPAETKPTEAKPEKPKKPQTEEDPFRDLVQDVEKFRKPSSPPPPSQTPASAGQQQAVAGQRVLNAPIGAKATMSELDGIRAQIEANWTIDTGAMGIEDMEVVMTFHIRPDGSVHSVVLSPETKARYQRDSAFRAMADGAVRAALKSSPLNYPREKYEVVEEITLKFRPAALLR